MRTHRRCAAGGTADAFSPPDTFILVIAAGATLTAG